ncbi:hypothetical protein BVRB_036200, partial [Beta vulgaris subsp. vulgaris]
MKLQIRGPSSRAVVSSLSAQSTIAQLLNAITEAVDVPADEQRLMTGFPPKELDLSNWEISLEDSGIKSGDSIIVENTSAKRGIAKADAKDSEGIIYSIPKNQG